MVGVYGIGVGPAHTDRRELAGVRMASGTPAAGVSADDVAISDAAQEASRVVGLVERGKASGEEVRAEQVAKARQSIQEGAYRLQGVVQIVAARMSRFVSLQVRAMSD